MTIFTVTRWYQRSSEPVSIGFRCQKRGDYHLPGSDLPPSLLFPFHSISQYLDLLLYLNPQDKFIKTTVLGTDTHPAFTQVLHEAVETGGALLRPASNCQQCRDKRLLYVREAEVICDLSNCLAELVRKFNLFVILELALPEMTVCDALFKVRVGEEILPIKSRRSFLIV